MATLTVMGHPSPGMWATLQKNRPLIVGRDPTCDLSLKVPFISRFHAQVLYVNGEPCLEDMGSTNGTFLNGRRLTKRERLADGDRIVLREISLTFSTSDRPQAVTPSETSVLHLEELRAAHLATFPVGGLSGDAGVVTLQSRLKSLVEIARSLGSSLDLDIILPRIVDLLFRMFTQAVKGEIHLLRSDGSLQPVAMKHGRNADSTDLTGVPLDMDLIRQVLASGEGLIRIDETGDAALALDDFQQCVLCAPIPDGEGASCGVILMQAESSSFGFGDDDLEVVNAIALLTGQAIGYSQAHDILVAHASTQRQLETARHIQLGMLPSTVPQLDHYAFHHHYAAAEHVGGDYLFYEKLRDGRIIFGIADASGKGLPAALNIVQFAGEVRFRLATSPTLKSSLFSLNKFIFERSEECMFITACIGVLDPVHNTLSLANAGHPSPLVKRFATGKIEVLNPTKRSFPLGILADLEVHPLNVEIFPGDQIMFYTDGLSEAMNPANNLFGEKRLEEYLKTKQADVEGLVSDLVSQVDLFREGRLPSDDMTIIGLERLRESELSLETPVLQQT